MPDGLVGTVVPSGRLIVPSGAPGPVSTTPGPAGPLGPTGVRPDWPIVFVFAGGIEAGQVINVPVVAEITIPANLAGSLVYTGSPPSADCHFTLRQLGGNEMTLSFTSGSWSFSGAAMTVPPGAVLQMEAPSPADNALADVGITILATRV